MTEEMQNHALNEMAAVVGAAHVRRDADICRDFSSDLFFEAAVLPLAVVAPGTRDETAHVVRIAAQEGVSIVPRGGGLSYTAGYVPQDGRSIVLDTTRLTRIIEINEEDQFVTAESGVTWQTIDDVVAPHGLRIPHFGPATGRVSTIGGGLSQNTVLFGSAQHGTAADHVLGLEVALADGSRIQTGSGAIGGGSPFFRYHGPDLAGLFLGDCGALGVKLAATMQCLPRPASIDFLSFSLPTVEAMVEAVCEIGRGRAAADVMGVGSYAPGRRTVGHPDPAIHIAVEGHSSADVAFRLAQVRQIAAQQGTEIDPAVPAFLRAQPFDFVTSLLAEDGRLQAWTHGIVPYSRALHVLGAVIAYFNSEASRLEGSGIDVTITVAAVGRGLLVEPVLRWSDRPRAIHLGGLGGAAESWSGNTDPVAGAAVLHLRRGLRDVFRGAAAAHLQIGKFYAYRDGLTDDTDALVMRLKHALDPHDRMNPGALGLG